MLMVLPINLVCLPIVLTCFPNICSQRISDKHNNYEHLELYWIIIESCIYVVSQWWCFLIGEKMDEIEKSL